MQRAAGGRGVPRAKMHAAGPAFPCKMHERSLQRGALGCTVLSPCKMHAQRDLCNMLLGDAGFSPHAKCMHGGIFAMRLLGGAVFPMQNACTGPCISLQVACTEGSLQCVAEGVQPSPCKMHARGDLCSTVQGGAAFPVPNAHAGPCTMHAQGWAVQLHARGTESHTPPPPMPIPAGHFCRSCCSSARSSRAPTRRRRRCSLQQCSVQRSERTPRCCRCSWR